MEELKFNVETVNLDGDNDIELMNIKAIGEMVPLKPTSKDAKDKNNQENLDSSSDLISNILNLINPIYWTSTKGYFDVTTSEVKRRIVKSFEISKDKNSLNHIWRGITNNNITFQDDKGDFEMFYCKSLDESKKSDLYGPLWIGVTLSLIIGMYSSILPRIGTNYMMPAEIGKLPSSFSIIFSYIMGSAISNYFFLWYKCDYTPLTLLLSIYGYSLSPLVPGFILYIFLPMKFLNWLVLIFCYSISILFRYDSLYIKGKKQHNGLTSLSVLIIPDLILLLALKIFIMNY
ncbi:Yip1 domain-containing protein [Cryptosporidium muris RN66]|uniref:Protein YIPF n=1 Tax=Cryptosporidium muris (strain RN66) TaxID=441375 RepID=B6A9H2_CRYMR|nr:Yip1 domain-containing protein [Cryptosporidium muris RN66]EEA04863.1 Yip1 domain-containing protein [Cryptosporidium muris RN66]|eukprot:XP_002139212.1 Yip1 domain-containing protein [Cryptosporidium muris RN66]